MPDAVRPEPPRTRGGRSWFDKLTTNGLDCLSLEKGLRLDLDEMDSRLRGNDRVMSLLRKQESRQWNKATLVSGERLMQVFFIPRRERDDREGLEVE